MNEPSTDLVAIDSPEAVQVFADLVEQARQLTENRHSDNTKKAYISDFAHFQDWCTYTSDRTGVDIQSLPAQPEAVYLYITEMVADNNAAGWAMSTLERRLSAIRWKHETNNHISPTLHQLIKDLMAGTRRSYGKPENKSEPLSTDQLRKILHHLDLDTLTGLRNRALLLFGYAGAFRRSELAGLDRSQLHRVGNKGYRVELVKTKDDQESQGRPVGIPTFPNSPLCPVTAIDEWMVAAKINTGAVFRKVTRGQTITDTPLVGDSIARLLKKMATNAGIPTTNISGHSLRAGHCTTAAQNGAPDRYIMDQTGHTSLDTLNGYIRPATVFLNNSADYLDLGPSVDDQRNPQ